MSKGEGNGWSEESEGYLSHLVPDHHTHFDWVSNQRANGKYFWHVSFEPSDEMMAKYDYYPERLVMSGSHPDLETAKARAHQAALDQEQAFMAKHSEHYGSKIAATPAPPTQARWCSICQREIPPGGSHDQLAHEQNDMARQQQAGGMGQTSSKEASWSDQVALAGVEVGAIHAEARNWTRDSLPIENGFDVVAAEEEPEEAEASYPSAVIKPTWMAPDMEFDTAGAEDIAGW